MSHKKLSDRKPVQDIQRVCQDILEYGVVIEGQIYWHQRLGGLPERFTHLGSPNLVSALSVLACHEILRRELVRWDMPLRSQLPVSFYKEGRANYIYVILQETRIKELATDRQKAIEFLDLKQDEEVLGFNRALNRVKEEIDRSSNPYLIFTEVVRRLAPK